MRLLSHERILLAVGALGLLLALGLDCVTWSYLSPQAGTGAWPDLPGQVLSSQVDQGRPKVSYEYLVGTKSYRAECVRYGLLASKDGWAEEIVKRFPEHSSVSVHYNPADPSQAVLVAGAEGYDLLLGLFLVSLHALSVGILVSVGATGWRRLQHRDTGSLPMSNRPDGSIAVQLRPLNPVAVFLLGWGGLALAEAGLTASASGLHVSWGKASFLHLVALVLPLLIAGLVWKKSTDTTRDLFLEGQGLSVWEHPKGPRTVTPWKKIGGFPVKAQGQGKAGPWLVGILLNDRTVGITLFSREEPAHAFSDWLTRQRARR